MSAALAARDPRAGWSGVSTKSARISALPPAPPMDKKLTAAFGDAHYPQQQTLLLVRGAKVWQRPRRDRRKRV